MGIEVLQVSMPLNLSMWFDLFSCCKDGGFLRGAQSLQIGIFIPRVWYFVDLEGKIICVEMEAWGEVGVRQRRTRINQQGNPGNAEIPSI
jgi:hypothetical protein